MGESEDYGDRELFSIISKEQIESAIENEDSELNLANRVIVELPNNIGRLVSLQELDLQSNLIETLPREIGNLASLTKIDLKLNKLTSLPEEFGKLKALRKVDLSKNRLNSLPETFQNCASLEHLNLGFNCFSQIPPCIYELTRLKKLIMNNNTLQFIPKEIGNLVRLKVLQFFNCKIRAYDPLGLSKLTKLTELDLYGNELRELPSLECLVSLNELYLGSNLIKIVPKQLGQLPNLRILALVQNEIVELPVEMGNLKHLEKLYLNTNFIEQLPLEIMLYCTALQELHLRNNRLRLLQPQMAMLPNLSHLDVAENKLSYIPGSLMLSSALQFLHLTNAFDISTTQASFSEQRFFPTLLELTSTMVLRNVTSFAELDTLNIPIELQEYMLTKQKKCSNCGKLFVGNGTLVTLGPQLISSPTMTLADENDEVLPPVTAPVQHWYCCK